MESSQVNQSMPEKFSGMDIHADGISAEQSVHAQESGGDSGDSGDSGGSDSISLPTFSDKVMQKLPVFLRRIANYGRNPKETDSMLLTAITVVSGCLPNICGVYDDKKVYANLFYILSARAGAGKGRSELCRRIAVHIHRRLRSMHARLKAKYESDLAVWETSPKKTRGSKPVKPAQTMLFIPSNTSATAFVQLLYENGGRGIIFDTEADGLSQSFESDFGDYSTAFRAAFHHESVAYHRRGNDEDVEVENPRLSVVLFGTPKQVGRLIGDVENGLFSRFMFYRLESDLAWRSVLGNQGSASLESVFDAIGDEFLKFYVSLIQNPTIFFSVTEEQGKAFDAYFSTLLLEFHRIFKDDIVGSVFRLGIICYRVAMVLSALRMKETGVFPAELVCNDDDFDTAIAISRVLAVHMAKIFDELSSSDGTRSASVAKHAKRKSFFSALPDEFDRKEYLEAADYIGVPHSTAEKWIHSFCKDDGPLEKVEHGRYRKKGS